jgi:hypothetical protein
VDNPWTHLGPTNLRLVSTTPTCRNSYGFLADADGAAGFAVVGAAGFADVDALGFTEAEAGGGATGSGAELGTAGAKLGSAGAGFSSPDGTRSALTGLGIAALPGIGVPIARDEPPHALVPAPAIATPIRTHAAKRAPRETTARNELGIRDRVAEPQAFV